MSEYIADRFANLLTKQDVRNLKKEIIRPYLKSKNIVLPRSRKKVLELSYSIDAIRTLEYLTGKSDNDLKEILRHYRDMVLTIGMKTQDPKRATEMLEKFEKTETKYQSIVKHEDFRDIAPFPKRKIEILRERVKILTSETPSNHRE